MIKILSWTFVFCFTVFALLQVNDPDPWIWVPAYLLSAYTAYCSTRDYYNPMLLIILLAGYALGAVMCFPEGPADSWLHAAPQDGNLSMATPFNEEARETMGLLICMAVNLVYLFLGMKKSKQNNYNIGFLYRLNLQEKKKEVEG